MVNLSFITDETEVSWSVCAAWMCLTQFIMSVVIVHLGLAILHCLVLLLSPLWYRQCTGVLYPCLLTTAAWVLPLLLIIPGATVLNTADKINCADPLSIETIISLHIPTFYGPGIVVVVIYSIVAYITQSRSRVTNQLHHEGVENAEHLSKIHRDRWSSILSNHSSMVTYNSETPSICSDNASVHSIPSIDIDDGSAVTISLPNGRNGFVHLNQAPPNRVFVNGDVSAADHVPNGYVPNGNAETPRRLITNGSAVCLPDLISPATSEDDKKKKQPPRDVLKQMPSDSDSMQLEIHKEDVDDDLGEHGDILRSKSNDNSNSDDSDTPNNVFHEPSDNSEAEFSQNVKENVNRKLSAISERDDSSSLSVKSDESASIKGTPSHTPHPTSHTGDSPVDTTTDEESSLATISTGSSDTQAAARPTDTQLNGEDNGTYRSEESDINSNEETGRVNGDNDTGEYVTTHSDNGDGPDAKPKGGKEQLNAPLDETEIEVSVETDKLVDADQSTSNGLDNFGFVLNDGEELSLAESIQVKHKAMDTDKTKQQDTEELIANGGELQHKDNTSSDGTQSGGHSRNSSQGGGINGPRRSILRRDRSKRQSAKSVKFDIPDTHDDNKPKRLNRKPTGKVPRNQQLRKKGSKASAKGNAATSKRRRTLVKQKAQSTDEPPSSAAAVPVSNGVISSVAPYAKRPPLLSSSSSFGYMAAVQSSQAERLNHRIRAQQVNVNTLFVVFLLYVALTGPHIVLACVRSLCATCNITTEVRISLQWLMFSASLILPVVMLCFLPEYRSAIRDPKAK